MMADDRSVSGLILLTEAMSPSTLSQIIGKDAASGLLGHATCVPEWAVRAAAVKGLKAVGIRGGWNVGAEQKDKILQVLNKVKHDRVKPVRIAAADALALYTELQVMCSCMHQTQLACVSPTPVRETLVYAFMCFRNLERQ